MSSVRGLLASSSSASRFSTIESLEGRQLFAIARPDHIVIVIEQIAPPTRLATRSGVPQPTGLDGLVYTNSHGVTHPSEPNIAGDLLRLDAGHHRQRPKLLVPARQPRALPVQLRGLSFSGYIENLPSDGSQVTQAGDGVYPTCTPQHQPDGAVQPTTASIPQPASPAELEG
jgi:hypothetical protein